MKPLNLATRLLMLGIFGLAAIGSAQAQAPSKAATTPAADDDKDGTTVMGDRESPIGLLIAPWREAAAEKDLDRPVRFLQEELIPLDAEVFRRQIEYYYTIAAHLRSRGVPGYAEPITISPLPGAAVPAPANAAPPAQ